MTRQEKRDIAIIAAVVLLMGALLGWTMHDERRGQTVPAAVLSDGQNLRQQHLQKVQDWAEAELTHIGRQFDIPPIVVAALDSATVNGWTVHAAYPVQYWVAVDWTMSEAVARKTAAHEAGHVLLIAAGLQQAGEYGERQADTFAQCFGSPMAAEYARKWGREQTGTCEDLRTQLTGRP